MNRDEDVLFLALSSHGSRDSTIAVSNTDRLEDGLSAGTLADLLEESGIKWRVVVVSACFSGTFVKPLADDHTIVITAASKNRGSFGCSDQRDLTYFGEAFYRDALPHSTDLRIAFETARRDIRRREREQNFTPSQPQGYFGPLMEEKLRDVGRRRSMTSGGHDSPARFITIPLSHYCEKARWGLDRVALPYREEPHAPLLNRLSGGTVPILVHGSDRFIDSTDILVMRIRSAAAICCTRATPRATRC